MTNGQSWKRWGVILLMGCCLTVTPTPGRAQETAELKAKAYQLYDERKFEESARAFQTYIEKNPADFQAAMDYAALLTQLKRNQQAADILAAICRNNPQNESACFKYAVELTALNRFAEAEQHLSRLTRSTNADMARAATEALRNLKEQQARLDRMAREQAIFEMAGKHQHQDALNAIAILERDGPLSFGLEMQRLYAMQNLQLYAPALEKGDRLAEKYPEASDLALLRANLLAQLGRRQESLEILRRIARVNANSKEGAEARQRLEAASAWEAEDRVYALARERKYREVLAAVNELEKTNKLSFSMQMQRLYALQSLGQRREALRRGNDLYKEYPDSAELALMRAELLLQQNQGTEANKILEKILADHAGTTIAFEAEKRLRMDKARREKNRREEQVFEFLRRQRHREALNAIAAMEKQEPLSFFFEMQRLYSLQAVGETAHALQRAEELGAKYPDEKQLMLLHAHLLAQQGRKEDAVKLLTRIETQFPNTPVSAQASRELEAMRSAPAPPAATPESRIYELANNQKYREVVAAVDALEMQGQSSLAMGMQKIYALQALGEFESASRASRELGEKNPDAPELALLRADLLIGQKQSKEASIILRDLKKNHAGTVTAAEAERRLKNIPAIHNLDKWYWGEAYNSGDYLTRFGSLVGFGFVRHGYFIPNARWLQPYAELRYTVDTKSTRGRDRSIITDNFIAASAAIRAQLLPEEYLFLYALGGVNKDFLDRREGGDPTWDYQAGIYGFKSWGPGTVLLSLKGREQTLTTGSVPLVEAGARAASDAEPNGLFLWRGDWFVDAGADFSYYGRYSSWIGYAQAHEGFRLFQIGPTAGVDAYLVENLSWDIKGNYFDNLIEIGPGARILWTPRKGLEVILRTEWLNGFYFGRDDQNTRRGAGSQYDDFRIGLSIGARW